MKKITFLLVLVTLLIMIFVFSGCSNNTTNNQNTTNPENRAPAPDFRGMMEMETLCI